MPQFMPNAHEGMMFRKDGAVPGSDPKTGYFQITLSSGEMTQHVLQDAAVLVVVELIHRIDAADQRHTLEAAVGRHNLGEQPLMRLEVAVQAANGDLLVALEPQRL